MRLEYQCRLNHFERPDTHYGNYIAVEVREQFESTLEMNQVN